MVSIFRSSRRMGGQEKLNEGWWTAPENGERAALILVHTPLVPTWLGALSVSQSVHTRPTAILHGRQRKTGYRRDSILLKKGTNYLQSDDTLTTRVDKEWLETACRRRQTKRNWATACDQCRPKDDYYMERNTFQNLLKTLILQKTKNESNKELQ